MSNLFFRPYVPGFRVRPDGVPGFNIDDNGLPRRASVLSDPTLPASAAQRYPDAAQTQTPPSISFRLPGAEGWVLSVPPIGSPGFRVSPQDDVPGFNVGSQDDAPGFNLDENGVQQQETTWSDGLPPGSVTPQDPNTVQTPPPPQDEEESAPPASPQLPEWPYQLGTMPPPRLPTAFDPPTGPRIEINSQPGVGPAAVPGADQWPPSSAPQQPPEIDIRSRAATTQNTNRQPVAQQAMRTAWLQPLKGGWPYAQGGGALPSIPSVRPPADSNFLLANAGDAGEQQAQQQTPLQQYQQTQRTMPSGPLGTGLATVHLPEKPGMKMTGPERGPEQDSSQFVEVYRRLKEAEGRQPVSDQRSPPPPNRVRNTSRGDNLGLIGSAQAQTQVQKPRVAQIDQSPRDAGGLPNGGIVSSIGSPDADIGNDVIDSTDPGGSHWQSNQGTGSAAGGILPKDLSIHLVGDGDAPSDLSPRERHELGIDASVATHLKRGFELITREQLAVDVPGFYGPRYYDYIIRDPATGKHYGVEVKTTLYETIRLKPDQVLKDAVVVAQGAKVRTTGLELNGVSYSTYCFGCEELDLRSEALQRILRNAGVPIARGVLPGDIRP